MDMDHGAAPPLAEQRLQPPCSRLTVTPLSCILAAVVAYHHLVATRHTSRVLHSPHDNDAGRSGTAQPTPCSKPATLALAVAAGLHSA